MEKIKSGIYGLSPLLYGGMNRNSTTVVIGAAGTGKTTLSIQYIRKGLEMGQLGIFVSLDENKEQIINEAVEFGWPEIHDYLEDKRLVFIDASGKKFADFIREELPSFVDSWAGADTRIAIDPLTPVMWSVPDRYEQRELLSMMLKDMKRIGTVLSTVEEYGTHGKLSGDEIMLPMYLSDCVIHLKHAPPDMPAYGFLKILKCRNSKHSKMYHSYKIMKGLGIVVDPTPLKKTTRKIPSRIIVELEKASALSPSALEKIRKHLSELEDDDFAGLNVDRVIGNILEEREE